tara:strand:+ start:5537 stop:6073 length:537 start_codon:yes stop_codon:yes gene_type:complete
MKLFKHTIAVIITAALALGSVSCITSDSTSDIDAVQVQAIAGIVETGTAIAVQQVLANNPETAAAFEVAAVAIKFAINSDELGPEAVLKLVQTQVGALEGAEAYALVELGVALALDTYDVFYRVNTAEAIPDHLKTMLGAIANGIDLGVHSKLLSGAINGSSNIRNPILSLDESDLKL